MTSGRYEEQKKLDRDAFHKMGSLTALSNADKQHWNTFKILQLIPILIKSASEKGGLGWGTLVSQINYGDLVAHVSLSERRRRQQEMRPNKDPLGDKTTSAVAEIATNVP